MISISAKIRDLCVKLNGTYNYSSTQFQVPNTLSKDIMEWGRANISKDSLYDDDGTKGFENDIHCTVFYGIKDPSPASVEKAVNSYAPFKVRLGLVTLFRDKPDYDVVKIEVESADTQKMHYDIESSVDHNNSFPTYAPHVTVAYVKKRQADDLNANTTFVGKEFNVDHIVFSSKDNTRTEIALKG